jgi:hypothetical protein
MSFEFVQPRGNVPSPLFSPTSPLVLPAVVGERLDYGLRTIPGSRPLSPKTFPAVCDTLDALKASWLDDRNAQALLRYMFLHPPLGSAMRDQAAVEEFDHQIAIDNAAWFEANLNINGTDPFVWDLRLIRACTDQLRRSLCSAWRNDPTPSRIMHNLTTPAQGFIPDQSTLDTVYNFNFMLEDQGSFRTYLLRNFKLIQVGPADLRPNLITFRYANDGVHVIWPTISSLSLRWHMEPTAVHNRQFKGDKLRASLAELSDVFYEFNSLKRIGRYEGGWKINAELYCLT